MLSLFNQLPEWGQEHGLEGLLKALQFYLQRFVITAESSYF